MVASINTKYAGAAVATTVDTGMTAASPGVGGTFTVADDTGYPASDPFVVVIDRGETSEEKIYVSSRSGTTFTVGQRGYDGTSLQAHTAGSATCELAMDATGLNLLVDHAEDTETDPHSTKLLNTTRHAAVTHTKAMMGTDSIGTTQIEDAAVIYAKLASQVVTPQRQVFTAGGTWNKPTNAQAVLVQVLAGGGAGGGAAATSSGEHAAGGGGGAGGYAESLLDASTLGASETVTVGAAGSGSSGAAGGDGGDSSFGVHVTANGGFGGEVYAATSDSGAANGGGGGIASGDAAATGGGGGAAVGQAGFGTPVAIGGKGGDSNFGGGGHGAAPSLAGDAGSRGGGGGGASNGASQAAKAGGAGGAGIVIATTFF